MRVTVKVLILFLVIYSLGCEGVVEFPGDSFEPELVITSEFSAHQSWYAVVQRTVGFDEVVSFPAIVESATITVTGNDGSVVELKHKGGGFYQSDCCRPRTGITYQLVAEADGFVPATAIDALPAPVGIKAARRTVVTREGQAVPRLEVDIEDDGAALNYYELSVVFDPRWQQVDFTILNAELKEQLSDYAAGDFVQPDLDVIYANRILLHDEAIDGKAITLILEVDPRANIELIGGPLSVKVRTVSEAYYHYWRSQQLQIRLNTDPFVEPVALRSNVEGGHGVFAGFAPETYGELSDAAMLERISGAYVITDFEDNQQGVGRNYIWLGGSGELELFNDNTAFGKVQLPIKENQLWSASLDGGFILRGSTIRLFHSAETVIRDIDFRFDPDKGSLRGNISKDRSQYVSVRFARKGAE